MIIKMATMDNKRAIRQIRKNFFASLHADPAKHADHIQISLRLAHNREFSEIYEQGYKKISKTPIAPEGQGQVRQNCKPALRVYNGL